MCVCVHVCVCGQVKAGIRQWEWESAFPQKPLYATASGNVQIQEQGRRKAHKPLEIERERGRERLKN